jgi:hypothetical protein
MSSNHNEIIATPEALVSALVGACEEFVEETKRELEAGLKKIGEESVVEIKKIAPVYKGKNKKTAKGAYRRNWTYRVDKERGRIDMTVHVKGRSYKLTHLLEYGHASRGGGRAKAIPHISIVNEQTDKKVDKLLEEIANGTK